MVLTAGELDRRIILSNKIKSVNPNGFQSWSLEEIARPWAKVRSERQRVEVDSNKESVTEETTTFEIIYRKGVTNALAITFEGGEFQIVGIEDPGYRHETLVLQGKRVNSRG